VEEDQDMRKSLFIILLSAVVVWGANHFVFAQQNPKGGFAVILQAGKESPEGSARALHAFLYSKELFEKGYEVVLIIDGAGTQWAEELKNPESQSKILPYYKDIEKLGISEVVCEYCAGAYGVKEKLEALACPLSGEYQGHPSIVKWVEKGYQLIVL
jgi:hypothetical protein